MVIDVGGTLLESESYSANTSGVWEISLDQPGTYEFWCSIGNHREQGMVGTITIE